MSSSVKGSSQVQSRQGRRLETVRGVRTHLWEAGEGPPMLLVHGGEFGASAELSWEHNVPGLATKMHVIAPDLVGYGLTEKLYNFEDMREYRRQHLWSVVSSLGVQNVWLAGNSAGASICLEIASRPEEFPGVAGVIAVSGGGSNRETEARRILSDYDGTRSHMALILKELFYGPEWCSNEYLERRYQSSVMPGAWESLAAARLSRPGARRPDRAYPDFTKIIVPVLLIGGADDRLKRPDELEKLATELPKGTLHIFERSRHCSQIEHAEAFNDLALSFIEDQGKAERWLN